MAVLNCTLEELVFAEKPKTKRFVDIKGQKFGRLEIIGYAGTSKQRTSWYCLCDCGNIVKTKTRDLRGKDTKSCGCLWPDIRKELFTKHGKCGSREYRTYCLILNRCNNPRNKSFHNYGGRGIKCHFESFNDFYAEVGDCPGPEYSIDRIDNEKGYERGNLRWATAKQQCRNTRLVTRATVEDCTKTIPDWAEEFGVLRTLIRDRKKLGWCDYCAVQTPPKCQPTPCHKEGCRSNKSTRYLTANGETLSVTQWANKIGLTPNSIFGRLHKGWCPTHAISPIRGMRKPTDCPNCNVHSPTSY